jgi:hypothetical protein
MITTEQGDRFISLYVLAADKVGLPNDAPFRHALACMLSLAYRSRCNTRTRRPTMNSTL